MPDNDRPLPTPPRSRFGRPLPEAEGPSAPLTADRMAQAAAEGRLDEFLQCEIPEGEHARRLVQMMMGMSGMMPQGMPGIPVGAAPRSLETSAAPPVSGASETPGEAGAAVSPDVLAATTRGDVAGLMALLRAEHERRSGEASPGVDASAAALSTVGGAVPQQAATDRADAPRPGIDQALVDEMIRVAAENQVSVDWLLLRAVKLYLEEHRRTGRL
jgi:hypothetical protein